MKQSVDLSITDNCPIVTIVCGNAYCHFNNSIVAVGGGMELRSALFGRGLAAMKKWQVNFVVSDFGQPFKIKHEDIDFYICQPTYRRAGRNVFPRFRKYRWFPALKLDMSDFALLWQIPLIVSYLMFPAICFPRFWRKLKPDVVCCFGNNILSAEVIADCHRLGIKTILCVASDRDLFPYYRQGNSELDINGMPKWKGHYSLVTADCIVVQTEDQQNALLQNIGRSSVLIRNPVNVSADDPQQWLPREQREYVLWIGRTDSMNKRPMLFLELAKSCPELQFLMIVSRTDEDVFLGLLAACPDNLRIVEHVPPEEIWNYIYRARLLINTSRFEGFPNTFLQCGVKGVPIVSLEVDPDNMFIKYGCGICAVGDFGKLRESVTELYHNHVWAEKLGHTCHQYVLTRHEASEQINEFEACISKLQCKEKFFDKPPWWASLQRYWRSPGVTR